MRSDSAVVYSALLRVGFWGCVWGCVWEFTRDHGCMSWKYLFVCVDRERVCCFVNTVMYCEKMHAEKKNRKKMGE